MVREIRGVLSLANVDRAPDEVARRWRVPIVKTEATTGAGIPELVSALAEHRAHLLAGDERAARRRRNLRNEVLAIATSRVRRRLEDDLRDDPDLEAILDQVVERRLDPASAASALLDHSGTG
jgi:LAO/AO transport system kinase